MRKLIQQKLHVAVILDLERIVLSDLNHKYVNMLQYNKSTLLKYF